MSRRLPLWNEEETDVLPQYQYSCGHVLVDSATDEWAYYKLFKILGVGRPSSTHELVPSGIPNSADGAYPLLSASDQYHFIIGQMGRYGCVFGPHHYFFNARAWIKWNKCIGGIIGFSSEIDRNIFGAAIFENGVKKLDADLSANEPRMIEETPIEAYLHGKKVFESKPKKVNIEPYRDFIRHDMKICYSREEGVTIAPRFTQHIHDADIRATHYTFSV